MPDPRTAARGSLCTICDDHPADLASGACARCAAVRALCDGERAEASALAHDFDLDLRALEPLIIERQAADVAYQLEAAS